MVQITEIQIRRADLQETRIVTRSSPALNDGQVLARIDTYALTANNVTYGVAGDTIGYWKFFPAEGDWGIIPVWGFATVVESRCPDVPVGDRVWGFLPMASHVVMTPGGVRPTAYVDTAEHRRSLPDLYNRYQRTQGDAPALKAMEVERCALFPLFTTAFVIADLLSDNGWFGAEQVVILSASSKTGFGLADILHNMPGRPVRVIGATSPGNRAFVESLGTCDRVIVYDEIGGLDADAPTIVVDMAGSAPILTAVHNRFRERLVYSCVVGATHWSERGDRGDLPGAKPAFFFAPSQIARRESDWGPGEILRRAQAEGARIAAKAMAALQVEHIEGAEPACAALVDMVAGRVSPSRILMLSMS